MTSLIQYHMMNTSLVSLRKACSGFASEIFPPPHPSRAREAARELKVNVKVKVDVSGKKRIEISAYDIAPSEPNCTTRSKPVRGLRSFIRNRWTSELVAKTHQGRTFSGLHFDSSKDTAGIIAGKSSLSIKEWKLIHSSRLDVLPLRDYQWSNSPTKTCRRCNDRENDENASHATNNCAVNLSAYTQRHDAILNILENLQRSIEHEARINEAVPGHRSRPDLETTIHGSRLMVDVIVTFDSPDNLESGYRSKVEKYQIIGNILPFVVGSLGSWYPHNDDIKSFLGISNSK